MLIKDSDSLENILEAIERIEKYTLPFKNADELFEDSKTFDAVLMNFIVIGEMAGKISDEFKQRNPEIN
jgi:uncharacterized protein with HEPN domain